MNYHNITVDDMLNGDGLRTVLWVSGCMHHCRGCQIRKHGTTRAVSRLTKPQKKSFLPIFRGIIWMASPFRAAIRSAPLIAKPSDG